VSTLERRVKGDSSKTQSELSSSKLAGTPISIAAYGTRALLCLSKLRTGTSTHTSAMATNATTTNTKLTIAYANRHMITTRRMIITLV
jgi:hypothetical protein